MNSVIIQYTSLVIMQVVEQVHNTLKPKETLKLKTLFKTVLKVWRNYHNSEKCHK